MKRQKRNSMAIIIAFLLFAIVSCKQKKHSLTVYAAASTTDIIEKAAKYYREKNNIDIKLNFASSGKLARQIEAGAPAEIFISASKKWMQYLSGEDLVSSEKVLMLNSLVAISYIDLQTDLFKLHGASAFTRMKGKISMGDPEHVPAGKYAKEALMSLGMYKTVEKRLLKAQSVRAALAVVEMNEAGSGIVYKTDALASKKVKIVYEFPEKTHSPVVYMIAVVKGRKVSKEVESLFKFLTGSEYARNLYKHHGFLLNTE